MPLGLITFLQSTRYLSSRRLLFLYTRQFTRAPTAMPKRISTFEVIEDSEPEREERRRQGIGEGMASIKKRTGENAINAKTATSVLELSGASSGFFKGP